MDKSSEQGNLLFRKVELWVVLLLALITFVGVMLYGALVRQVALGGKEVRFVGKVAYALASVPSNLKDLVLGSQPDFITYSMSASALDRDQYSEITVTGAPSGLHTPVGWINPDAAVSGNSFQPAAMMFRLNKDGDEHVFLFDEQRKVVKNFAVTAGSLSGDYRPLAGNSSPRFLDDGSYIIHSHGSDGLYRKDICGNITWSIPGLFHHTYSIADGKIGILGLPKENISPEDQALWNSSDILNIIDVETGTVERSVPLVEIARKNASENDPLSFRFWFSKLNENEVIVGDPVHLNKFEILPDAMADEYPDLPKNAWLLSSRMTNLLFIVDPETLEIVWHTQGHTQGQHDPDFIGDNKIVAFNNSFQDNSILPDDPTNFSSIREFVVGTDEWSTLYSTAAIEGYTSHSGEIDTGPDGQMLLTLTDQGRYAEVSSSGELLAEFINTIDNESVYWVKSAQYLSNDQFNAIRGKSCAVQQ